MKRKNRYWTQTGKGAGERRKKGFLLGLIVGILFLVMFISVVTIAVEKGMMSLERAGYAAKGSFATAVFVGSVIASKRAEKHKLVKAAAVGFGLFGITAGGVALTTEPEGLRLWIPAGLCLIMTLIALVFPARARRVGYR